MALELTKHIIAAKSLFFGTSYFLILPLPMGWGITRSYLEPDVHSTVRKENLIWVEAGQTDQVVFHPIKKVALDLMIRVRRGKHDNPEVKGMKISSQGSRVINGHEALYFIGEVNQGMIKKKSVKTLRLFFYCPELKRTVSLHFTGKCQDADLVEIYESVTALECH